MSGHDETISGSAGGASGVESLPYGLLVALEVLEGPDKGKKQDVSSTRTVIGRKESELVLSDPTVSGKHAILEYAAGKLFITDNHSTNGVELNGKPVESAPVGNLDVVKLGDTKILVSVVEDRYGAFSQPPGDDMEDARMDTSEVDVMEGDETAVREALPNPPLPESLHVVMEVLEGPDRGTKVKVKNRSTVVGRGERADVKLNDPAVSNRHFQLEVHNKDKMTIKDLASSNGTRLNDQYVSAVKIRHGDVAKIGDTKIKFLIHVKR